MNRTRKLILAFLGAAALAAIVIGGLATRPETSSERPENSEAAARVPGAGDPDQVLKEIAPSEFSSVLERSEGRPVMVDFWASWCEPCRFEMPFITNLRAKYEGRIDFIGVNYQDERGAAADFVRDFNINFPSYRDPDGKIGQAQGGIIGMPTAIFFEKGGREHTRKTGAFATEEKMEEVLLELLR